MRGALCRRLSTAGFVFFILLLSLPHVGVLLAFPNELRLLPGQEFQFDAGPLFSMVALPPSSGSPPVDVGSASEAADRQEPTRSESPDEFHLELRFLGLVPVQRARVQVVSQMAVVPGGQAIGILLSSNGLVVVRTAPVLTAEGAQRSPAAEAGILPGDIILKIGNKPLDHPVELESLTGSYGRNGRPLPMVIRRAGREMHLSVDPVLARDPRGRGLRYMVGLYLKDPAAGVGTLTFWEPTRGMYGALGHMITDGGEAVSLHDGRIVAAHIHGIQPGARGRPGEKLGIFESSSPLGTIEKNTQFGIFGRLSKQPAAHADPVPVALSQEVREGKARILTVLQGGRVESFDVEIVAVHRQARPSGKGLVLEVTDPRLLERTSGIVQGMSGSPILQNGKLVGAVTHVFINDPIRGFGVLAEWMVYEAGIGGARPREPLVERRRSDAADDIRTRPAV